MKRSTPKEPQGGILGLAFDAEDDQKRITRGKNFLLAGGSKESHAQMQETVVKVNEKLDERGKRLETTSAEELRDIFHDVVS